MWCYQATALSKAFSPTRSAAPTVSKEAKSDSEIGRDAQFALDVMVSPPIVDDTRVVSSSAAATAVVSSNSGGSEAAHAIEDSAMASANSLRQIIVPSSTRCSL